MVGSRRPAAASVTFIALCTGLVVLIVVLTPWRLPVGDPTEHVMVQQYFSPAQLSHSDAFYDAAKWPAWLGLAASLVGAAVVGFGGLGAAACRWVCGRLRAWPLRVCSLAVLFLAFQAVITAPFAIWSSLVSRHYGMTVQTWWGWAQDRFFGWLLLVVVVCVALLVGGWLAHRYPRRWWIAAGSLSMVAVFGFSFAYPVVVEPIFNSVSPMPSSPLRTELLRYAARDGLNLSDVLVADASSRSSAYNAYVSGFGSTRQLVVYDNLLHAGPDAQVEVIVAHELGHVREHDVLTGTVLASVAAGAGTVGLFLLLGSRWWRTRNGTGSLGDPVAVPFVLSLVVLGSFLAQPVQNAVSRHVEARADLHSLVVTHDPTAYLLVQQRLATNNLAHLTPNPALAWWFKGHPSVLDRISMGVAWEQQHGRTP